MQKKSPNIYIILPFLTFTPFKSKRGCVKHSPFYKIICKNYLLTWKRLMPSRR